MNLIKLQDTKLILRNLLHFYALTAKDQKEIKETIPFTSATKRIKYLGINLPKEAKDLYTENYKILIQNQRRQKQMERYTMFLDWKNQYCENDYSTQNNLQIQCNPYQITNGIFHRTRTKIFTICMETQKTSNSKSNLGKQIWIWRNQAP